MIFFRVAIILMSVKDKLMTKINFHFHLLQARFPELHQEAQIKIDGGVKPSDIMADWLSELICLRRGISSGNVPPVKQDEMIDDTDFAASVMASLSD